MQALRMALCKVHMQDKARQWGALVTSTCISHYWWHMTKKKMIIFRFAPMICYDSTRYLVVCVYDMDMNLNICTVYIVFAYVYPAHVLSTYFKDIIAQLCKWPFCVGACN